MKQNDALRKALRRAGAVGVMALLLLVAAMSGGRAVAVGDAIPPRPAARPQAIPTDQLIIRFHDGPGATRAARQIDRLSTAAGRPLAFVRPMSGGAYVYRLPSPMAPDAVTAIARDLMALPEVAYAEPDLVMRHTGDVPQRPGFGAAGAAPRSIAAPPDDPSFADQWHYRYEPGVEEGANLLGAWDITTGSADIVVAVLDTGIRLHADLAGRTVPGYDFISNPINGNDNDPPGNPLSSRDADPSDPGDWNTSSQCDFVARDSSWHGTHVAGTIGASSNNGADVVGVNWQAKIQPVRVLGRCGGATSDIIDAIRWSAGLSVPGAPPNPTPARVINMSLGGMGICQANSSLQLAINDAVAAGAVVVVAAGNSLDIADFYSPAGCAGVVTVAAGTRGGDLAWYSNFGSTVEITAPGGEVFPTESDGILSTLNEGTQGPGNDSLAFYQGTSMAAPHVAGVAALLLGQNPALSPAGVGDLLIATARDFPDGAFCIPAICGAGLLDAYQALWALESGLLPPHVLAPDDGATLNTPKPLFEWAAVDGASGYGLVVSTDETFVGDAVVDTTTGGTSFVPAAPLADGTYYWRVNASDGAETSEWSEKRSFTIDTSVVACETPLRPTLLSPGDGSTYELAEVMFMWESLDEPPFYELRVSQDADFSTIVIGELVDATDYTDPTPLDEGTYYWSVRGRNHSKECAASGEWSEVWSFAVEIDEGCPMPGTPQLLAPADGATTAGATPALSWAAADNATAYFVYVDDDADLSSPEIAETTSATTYAAGPLPPGVYYWGVRGHVRVAGECEQSSPLSEIRRLTVEEETEFLLYLPGVVR